MKKKILTFLIAICLIIPCMFGLASCKEKEKDATKTMTTTISQASSSMLSQKNAVSSNNTEITFMLDNKNKVTSISYGNDSAGRIFANVNFVGMDSNSAIQVVIEQSAISGHINLSGSSVTFEFSGEDLEKLKEQAEAKTKEVFEKMGVQVTVTVNELSEKAKHDALVSTALLLAPEKSKDEIKSMSDADLIKLIDQKQKDYKDLAYDQINEIQDSLDKTIIETIETIRTTLESLEEQIKKYGDIVPDTIKQEYSKYKKLLNEEINNFLEDRKSDIESAKKLAQQHKNAFIELYKTEVANAETGLKAHLDSAKENGTITEEQYNYWIALIENNKA